MQIGSSLSSSDSTSLQAYDYGDMDGKLSADGMAAKDTDSSGDVSAAEFGITDAELAEFDADGDGRLSDAELSAALAVRRGKMRARMSDAMQQRSQFGMLQTNMDRQGTGPTGGGQGENGMIRGAFGGDGSSVSVFSSSSATENLAASNAAISLASNAGRTSESYLKQTNRQALDDFFDRLDDDGDGAVGKSESAQGLSSREREMAAEAGGAAPLPPQGAEAASDGEATAATDSAASSFGSVGMDALMAGMFGSSASTGPAAAGAATSGALSDSLLRRKANSAYESMGGPMSRLFGGSSGISRSVSTEA